MRAKFKIMHNYIQLTIPIGSTLEELIEWNQILYKILIYAFYDKPVFILTLSPQKYSLGYELYLPEKIKIEKKEFLINYCHNLSTSLIQQIIESEEFERGLMKILIISNDQLEDVIKSIPSNYDDLDKFKYELIELENDGQMLCWINPHLPTQDIERKLKEIGITFI
jgi:hypothetical protein